ncbi:MAG: glycosyltransferase family 2 protein [Candidatus Shapirobacteria bacterium]|nr:glycosyltransferase family 2 protein [Candidatus Shapirobacteria bacterium]
MTLSIIIVSYNTKKLLQDCLESIKCSLAKDSIKAQIIIVDNNSSDGTQEYLKSIANKRGLIAIFNKDNAGFAKANNQGIERARGKYVLLLNSDTILTEGNFFTKTIRFLEKNKKIGILGPRLLWENGQTQPSGGYFPILPRLFTWALMIDDLPLINKIIKPYHPHGPGFYTKDRYYQKPHYQDWVTGACFFIKREVIKKIGFLDENIFMYTEEMEYCYRAKKAGFDIVYYPETSLIHLGGKSGTSLLSVKNEFQGIKYFYQKHQPAWQKPIAHILLKIAARLRKAVFCFHPEKSTVYQQVLREL